MVEKRIRPRQARLKLPAESLSVRIPLIELGPEPISRKNKRIALRITQVHDTIFAQASCDALERQILVQDSIIHTLRTIHDKKTVYVDRPHTPWYTRALAWVGGLSLLLLGIEIFLKRKMM